MPLQEINRQWIYYEDTGGTQPPIVLAHGLLMDHEMFAPQLEALSSQYRMITWDARCHGETEATDDPFTYWDLAEDLSGLLDHLGITRAVIGGMGQGGNVSLRFALKHPERVAALILLSTQAGIEDPEKVAIYESMVDVWEAGGLNDQMAESIAALIFGHEWPDALIHGLRGLSVAVKTNCAELRLDHPWRNFRDADRFAIELEAHGA